MHIADDVNTAPIRIVVSNMLLFLMILEVSAIEDDLPTLNIMFDIVLQPTQLHSINYIT